MLNLINKENNAAYLMKFAKKAMIKIKFQKNEGYFFGKHPLVEMLPIYYRDESTEKSIFFNINISLALEVDYLNYYWGLVHW